jgi:hypothetical protein
MGINRDIEKITKDDLQALIDNEVIEHKTIEYKKVLPSNSDREKKEFLADVSSFANTNGGDIIYGITEDKKTGKPKSLDGLDIENPDKEILRLDNIIRTGIQPRLPSVTISPPIHLENSKVALIIRVPKSWINPHRVVFNGHDKFYTRSSNGKYPLDVNELRTAFNMSETIIERIRNFRTERISRLLRNETPEPFYETAKIVLHLIPISSFNLAQVYDINCIASNPTCMPPMHSGGMNWRYNLDGFLTYSKGKEGVTCTYVQLFRSGIIEAVEGSILEPDEHGLYIPSRLYEEELIRSLTHYLTVLKTLGVVKPIFVMLNLLGVKGYIMGINPERYFLHEVYKIDRDNLLLPEILIEDYEDSSEKILKPTFDSIWNACGFQRSFNFNENGEWAPR